MRNMLKFLHQHKSRAIAGLIFKMLAAGMELTIPYIMALLINGDNSLSRIYQMGGLILLVVLINITFDLICQYFASVSSAGIGMQIRKALFDKVNTLAFSDLDEVGITSLTTRITSDVTQVQQATAMGIRLLSRAPFMAVGALIMAMIIDMKLSLLFLAVILLVLLASALVRKFCSPMYIATQKGLDTVISTVKQTLSGIRVFSAFNMQPLKKEEFDGVSDDYRAAVMRVNSIASLLSPVTQIIINLAVVGVVYFGGQMTGRGEMPAGDIMALTSYLFQVLIAMNVISMLIVLFTKAEASAQRINDILTIQSDMADGTQVEPLPTDDILKFEHVTFEYRHSALPQLNDINFTIKKRQRIGIIGGTGSGKSTLIHLIARAYDVTDGSISVLGRDVRDWEMDALRDHVSIARQRAQMLNETVRENIRFGSGASDDMVIKAAEMAQANEFIDKMDRGYDHVIEQEGRNLSGGQKQRISLARALARGGELLIIDNGLSALDFLTDSRVRANLNKERSDQTIIMISERVSTLKNCDNILVMQEGALIAQGDHDQLMKGCELYKEIAASQLG